MPLPRRPDSPILFHPSLSADEAAGEDELDFELDYDEGDAQGEAEAEAGAEGAGGPQAEEVNRPPIAEPQDRENAEAAVRTAG